MSNDYYRAQQAYLSAARFLNQYLHEFEKAHIPIVITPSDEVVEFPPHYMQGGIEVGDFIDAQGFGHREACVIEYICRAPYKGGVQDLQKAAENLQRRIRQMQGAIFNADQT